ncbi:MAG: DUF5667 domain-containing protein [bacterium]|nr:DUF5667 domain-containing protein [bacterium]
MKIFFLFILAVFFVSFEGKASLISSTPDQPEYIEKVTYEIIQAVNLASEIKKAKFFIIIAYKRLEEAVRMAEEGNYIYVEELSKAYKECLVLGMKTYGILKERGDREEILFLLKKSLFNSVIDLTYLLRNSPKNYKNTIQKTLDYTLNKRKEVEKIIEEIKKDKDKLKIDK